MTFFPQAADTFLLLLKGKARICLAFCANFLFERVTEVSFQTCYRLSEGGTDSNHSSNLGRVSAPLPAVDRHLKTCS